MIKKRWYFFVFVFIACQPSIEEAQRHHNQIMVAQNRVVAAFDQLDSSLLDTNGYRQLYWEYDSVLFFIQQMKNVLDTIRFKASDSSLIQAGRKFTQQATTLHSMHYPNFLDAYRKFHALGNPEDSLIMVNNWELIQVQKNNIQMDIHNAQDVFVKEYNLTLYPQP